MKRLKVEVDVSFRAISSHSTDGADTGYETEVPMPSHAPQNLLVSSQNGLSEAGTDFDASLGEFDIDAIIESFNTGPEMYTIYHGAEGATDSCSDGTFQGLDAMPSFDVLFGLDT